MKAYWEAFRSVFGVFLKHGRRVRRTKFFVVFSLLPVAVSLIIRVNELLAGRAARDGSYLFTNVIMVFYLQMIVLLLALFYGTSVCSEEIEGRTLPYLATRPLARSAVLLGKYAAYTLITVGMAAMSLVLSFVVLEYDRLLEPAADLAFLRYLGVLTLGLIVYGALFTLLGTALKRSVFFGLLFSFGWENIIQYFPGSTQRLAVAHYLKSFLPMPETGRFAFLTFRLEPTPPGLALLILGLMTAVFLALAGLVFSKKEYLFED